MKNEKSKKEMFNFLLPDEKSELNSKMSRDDMLINIGWNLYRQKLCDKLKI